MPDLTKLSRQELFDLIGRAGLRNIRAFARRASKKPHKCAYCGKAISSIYPAKFHARATADHVIPKCLGGNITVPACYACNQKKANRLDGVLKIALPEGGNDA